MRQNILSIGDKIELYLFSNRLNYKNKQKKYVSQLLDLSGDNKASLAMPIEGGRIIPLEIGETYSLRFYTKHGLYECECIVLDRYKNQNLFIAVVEFISDLEKKQRRQYFRLECVMDLMFRVIPEYEINLRKLYEKLPQDDSERQRIKILLDKIQEKWNKGVITDISGGGLRFSSEDKEDNNEKLLLSFSLDTASGIREFRIIGSIVSVNPIENKRSVYEYRIKFTEISKEDRETIVRYIFDEERKQRRKERGIL